MPILKHDKAALIHIFTLAMDQSILRRGLLVESYNPILQSFLVRLVFFAKCMQNLSINAALYQSKSFGIDRKSQLVYSTSKHFLYASHSPRFKMELKLNA